VLLVKYKTVKQLREVRDPRYLPESLSQKDARHLQVHSPSYPLSHVKTQKWLQKICRENLTRPGVASDHNSRQETTARLEADYRHLISEVVPAGSNLMLVCAQVMLCSLTLFSLLLSLHYSTISSPTNPHDDSLQIAARIELEQGKAVWVPSAGAVW
jgi:hypothetical protein